MSKGCSGVEASTLEAMSSEAGTSLTPIGSARVTGGTSWKSRKKARPRVARTARILLTLRLGMRVFPVLVEHKEHRFNQLRQRLACDRVNLTLIE